MSILKKPYEISIWDDEWDASEGKFVERKVCTIGSNTLQTQSKVFSPKLKRNVNGSKSLTFQIYARYVDNFTGEWIDNPYVNELISERKVKLNYNNDWYDFIVKNVQQDSTTYLYTYQLEDAVVNELSKNGFGMAFDQLLNNNIGTAKHLAETALADTDWEVAADSEVLVQTVEESLVWLQVTNAFEAKHIQGQKNSRLFEGVTDNETEEIPANAKILAFYSSCTNKPHRFQFIYLNSYEDVAKDKNRVIEDKDCQYYVDINLPDTEYKQVSNPGYSHFYLPLNLKLLSTIPEKDTQISYLYRGSRYGYSMQSEYVPLLNKYVNLYKKDNIEYYGYVDVEYISPTIVKTYTTNPTAESVSGWTGAKLDGEEGTKSAKVELAYGRFKHGIFVSCVDDTDGNFEDYDSYIKVVVDNKSQVVFNSGPYDNRYDMKYLHPNSDVLVLSDVIIYKNDGAELTNPLQYFNLGEYVYDSNKLAYKKVDTKIKFSPSLVNGSKEFAITENGYNNEKEFTKRSKLRLCFAPPAGTYYIKQCYLYKKYVVDNNVIKPTELSLEDEGNIGGAIQRKYCYIEKSAFIEANYASKDEIEIDDIQDVLSYEHYKPIYNTGAEKVRSISIAESNYFNILSTLAETFGAWLDLKISRDHTGSITKKEVAFRNYVGNENYAGFRYGVNLQGIQRTYESKGLVTKLIVKANSNELAENGFCTIQRATSNETGENYLYDFQYYHNQGILPAEDFLPIMQSNFEEEEAEPTLNGYYTRIKDINNQMSDNNDKLSGLKIDLVTQKSNYETAEFELEAAESTIAECVDEYITLTGVDFETRKDITQDDSAYELLKSKEAVKLEEQYFKALATKNNATERLTDAEEAKIALENQIKELEEDNDKLKEVKTEYNKLFYKTYSRFIQEGTWISEEYIDDEKYYIDAQSVLYNSCYPQVGYTINVLEMSQVPGYEGFSFNLGDKTFVEDPNFFGADYKEEVVVTETVEDLDNPKNNTLAVQNYKTQFQDLFQKITATVQQAQYSTGSYKKAVALANADPDKKQEYLSDAMSTANASLSVGGQTNVIQDSTGITLYKTNDKSKQLKLVGGAILVSKEENGEIHWSKILDPDGISANQISTGVLNANSIKIMNGDQATFTWDSYGISAYDWDETAEIPNYKKFVRFDKNGIYGIDDTVEAGWVAQDLQEIDHLATFALTWQGLKVTGNNGAVARIGKVGNDVMRISKTVDGVEQVLMNIASNDDPDYHSTFCGWTFENNKLIAPSGTGKGQVTLSSDSISITDSSGNSVMNISADGQATFCGWTIVQDEDGNRTLSSEKGLTLSNKEIYLSNKGKITLGIDGNVGVGKGEIRLTNNVFSNQNFPIFTFAATKGRTYIGQESEYLANSLGILITPVDRNEPIRGGGKPVRMYPTSDQNIRFTYYENLNDSGLRHNFIFACYINKKWEVKSWNSEGDVSDGYHSVSVSSVKEISSAYFILDDIRYDIDVNALKGATSDDGKQLEVQVFSKTINQTRKSIRITSVNDLCHFSGDDTENELVPLYINKYSGELVIKT